LVSVLVSVTVDVVSPEYGSLPQLAKTMADNEPTMIDRSVVLVMTYLFLDCGYPYKLGPLFCRATDLPRKPNREPSLPFRQPDLAARALGLATDAAALWPRHSSD
jgi:hypothetical protein